MNVNGAHPRSVRMKPTCPSLLVPCIALLLCAGAGIPTAQAQQAGVTISPTALMMNENSTATYTAVLATAPTGDVTVTPTSDTPGEVSVSGALTFSSANWNTARTVTVTAHTDDNSAHNTATITHAVTGYGSVTVASGVAVTVTDANNSRINIQTRPPLVTEGNDVVFQLTISPALSASITLPFTVTPDTASASDYTVPSPAHVVLLSGATTGEIRIPTVANPYPEGQPNALEFFGVTIGPLSAAAAAIATIGDAVGTGRIQDAQNGAVAIGFEQASYTVLEGETVDLKIVVKSPDLDRGEPWALGMGRKSLPLQLGLRINQGGSDSANPGEDYEMPPPQLGASTRFGPRDPDLDPDAPDSPYDSTYGLREVTLSVPTTQDFRVEDNETFTVTLGQVSGDEFASVRLQDHTVTVTIENDDSPAVNITPTAVTVNEGDTDTYTVVLGTEPTGNVTITPVMPGGDVTVSGAMIFDANNWNTARTVTISTFTDTDGVKDIVTISHTVRGYGSIETASDVTVTVQDPDTEMPGVSITPEALTVDEGRTATYTAVLTSVPTGDVRVTPTTAHSVLTLSGALTFDTATWNIAKTVTVTTIADDDAIDSTATITHAVIGYGAVTADPVIVTVSEDSAPSFDAEVGDQTYITGTPIETLPLPEATGGNGTLNYTLTGNLPDGLRFDANTRTLTGTPTTVTAAVTMTYKVTDADDNTTADDAATLTFTVTVEQGPEVRITPAAITVAEGASTTYVVELATVPTGNVMVTPATDQASVITLSGALTFSTANWNTAQTVTATAPADTDAIDSTAIITNTVTGYGGITAANVSVTVEDAQMPRVVISPTALTMMEGAMTTYTAVLTIAPTGNVMVTPGGTSAPISVSGALTFSTATWNTAQAVTVTAAGSVGVDDAMANITHAVSGYGDVTTAASVIVTVDLVPSFGATAVLTRTYTRDTAITTLTLPEATSGNGALNYALTGLPDGLAFDPPTRTLTGTPTTSTLGATLTYTATDADANMAAGDTATLTFTVHVLPVVVGFEQESYSWPENVVQRDVCVTVKDPEQSAAFDGMFSLAVSTSPGTATGADYTAISNQVVGPFSNLRRRDCFSVEINDDMLFEPDEDFSLVLMPVPGTTTPAMIDPDLATVTIRGIAVAISPTDLTMEEGDMTTYTVVLPDMPAGDVTVTPDTTQTNVIDDPSGALTFSTATWNTAQTVTVSAIKDENGVPDIATITHTVSGYGSVTARNVIVTVNDLDEDMVTINPTALTMDESDTTTYTVELRTLPLSEVTVTLSVDVRDTPNKVTLPQALPPALTYALTFSTTNWNTAQTVTVSATNDDDGADEIATITHTVSGYGLVTAADDVTVMVVDDDTDGVIINPTDLTMEEGDATTYTVELNTMPRGDVTVTTSTGRITGLTPEALTFSTSNWNTARTVTVTTEIDNNGDNETATVTHTVSGYESVTTAETVTITIIDIQSAPDFGDQMVPDQNYTVYEEIKPPLVLPEANGGVGTLVYNLTGAIPAGLIYADTDRTLSGVPTAVTQAVTLTWTATDENNQRRSLTFSVTIVKTDRLDNLNRVILPEVARAMADDRVGAISRRIRQAGDAASGPMAGSLTLGGQSTLPGMLTTHGRAYLEGTLNLKSLLGGSDFVLPLHASGAGRATGLSGVTLWGGGNYRSLSGNGDGVDWGGDMFSAHLGADTRLRDDLLAGVAVSWSEVDLDYDYTGFGTGDYEVSLTSVHPYVGWTALAGRLDMWATVGYGWGELEIANDTDNGPAGWRASSDVTMQTVGAGGSAQVLEGSAATVRIKGEALQTTMDVEGNARASISALKVEARRLRVGLEASQTHQLAIGGQLIPTLEVGMRHDAGDGRTGTGAEVGGSVRYTDAAHGLTIESHGRVLLGHGGDYEDWGVGGSVRVAAGQDGHGLSFSLQPTWGATASRVAQVWAQEAAATVSSASRPRDGRVDLNVGYGLGWDDAMVTPYGQLTLTNGQTRAYRLGSRMQLGSGIALNLEGTRQETATQPVDHGVLLQIGMGF